MKTTINWGIIGCGYIANHFATALLTNKHSKLIAVASASSRRAKEYADKFHVQYFYDNYKELIERSDIDIVYIANCSSLHKKSALECLKNGKSVLCEKPLAINLVDSKEIIESAKKNNVFLMEGMWMKFLPAVQKAKALVDSNIIGNLRMIKADFGFTTSEGSTGRHLNPELAGGALLDVGIYPLTLANFLFSKFPIELKSSAHIGKTGIDEVSAYLLTYDAGELALLSSAVNLNTAHNAEIIGTNGRIMIPDFWHAQKIILHINNQDPQEMLFPFKYNGFEYEITEVVNCLIANDKESKIMSWNDTLQTAAIMDKCRNEWGLRYPGE